MKKITLFSLLLISAVKVTAQENTPSDNKPSSDYNRWTIEAMAGQAKGLRPYAEGYYSSDPATVFGKPEVNSYSLGARYMVNRIFGFRGNFYYQDIHDIKDNHSKPFETEMFGASAEGVINANRLFETDKVFGRFGLLVHGGIKIDHMTSKTPNNNYGHHEWNGSLLMGVTPEFRITNRMAVFFDVSFQTSNRQHLNWDGSFSEPSNNLSGQMFFTSLGVSYSLGKNDMHGDWAVVANSDLKKMEDLNQQIEEMKKDTDNDGVPDYIDLEKNSFAGVAVDSKGRNIETNKTAPDEVEKDKNGNPVNQSTTTNNNVTNSEVVMNMINDGYKAVYFNNAQITPTESSTEAIDFVRTYLINNKNAKVDVIGHADEIGTSEYNRILSEARAQRVKAILVSSGIDYSRLRVVPEGEDTSVDKKSSEARKLVRKVTFKITDNN